MKRSGLTPPLLSATLFLILTSAPYLPAQDAMAMAGSPAAKAAKRADDLLKRYDKNGDGKLDDDERADAKEVMLKDQVERQLARATALPGGLEGFRTQVLAMFDKNRDGRLYEDEQGAAKKFAAMRDGDTDDADDLNKRFDKNGDGKIDPEERAMINSFLAELRALGGGQMRIELLRRFDRNADSKVDENELAELEKFVRPRIESSPTQLSRYDTNRDGKLEEAEWKVARAAIAQWLNASGPAALENDPNRPEDPSMIQRVTDEVARRRIERERTMESGTSSTGNRGAEMEQARLQAVAEEVTRRRAERPGQNPNNTTK